MTLDHDGATLRMPWLSMAATILLAAAILVVLRPNLEKRLKASVASRVVAGPVLRATPQGDSLRITWPAGARAAALSIKDGEEWHRIELNQKALAAGQYLYRPSSTEVMARLDESGTSETVRLLGLGLHEAPAAPAPAPVVEVAKEIPAPAQAEESADRAVTTSPEIADRKTPVPLPKALRTVHGVIRVDVQVVVAADGTVQSAQVMTPGGSVYFNRLSLEAAQGSRFQPAAGGPVVLRYEYSREGVQLSQPGL